MKKILLILVLMSINSFGFDIKNAKIGSTIISNWSRVGHAAIVVKEYTNDANSFFIIGSHSGGVRYDSYNDHLEGGNKHLGHFRSVSRNYTFKERQNIKRAAERAAESDTGYEVLNFYIYDWDSKHKNNIPYKNIIPTDFRCDGLAEWATEIGINSIHPKEIDGFYRKNTAFYIPRYITIKPVDKIDYEL